MSRAGSEVRGRSSLNEQLYTGVTGPKGAEKPPSEAPHRERPGERIRWGRRRGQARGTALFLFDVEKSVDRETVSICDGQWVRRQPFFVRFSGGRGFVPETRLRIPGSAIVSCPVRSVRGKRVGRSRCGLYVASRAGTQRLSQIVQATAERTQRSSQFSLPTEKIYRKTGLSPHNTGKLYRPTRCRGLTTNRFPHRSSVEIKSGRGWKRKSRLHAEKSP
jgi:hypothetical protein